MTSRGLLSEVPSAMPLLLAFLVIIAAAVGLASAAVVFVLLALSWLPASNYWHE